MAKPKLRFDKVAIRFVAAFYEGLSEAVPAGKTLVVTCTAPIWQPSKTAGEVIERVARKLARGTAKLEIRDAVNGNQIRVRLVSGRSRAVPNVVGFVHNPDVDGDVIIEETAALLRPTAKARVTR